MVVGIVCEYNPFHNGHLYQIKKIREQFGEDAVIVAIMSGNYVQRGGTSIADKGLRAKCAVLEGVNLVLELPFPYSMSSAELFAGSAVSILNDLGCVDVISFGSECGSIDALTRIADAMLTDEYIERLDSLLSSNDTKGLGYPELCEMALGQIIPNFDNTTLEFTPNNILAIEYIKALRVLKSRINPHTIKRVGSAYDENDIVLGDMQSATAIREAVLQKDISALEYIPEKSKKEYLNAIKDGQFPCDYEKLSSAIIASFRLNPSNGTCEIHDAKGGLYNRLRDISFETDSIEKLVCLAETKKFTRSRIRRAIFNAYLSVTSSQVKAAPLFTQVLAMDDHGRAILKEIGKQDRISVLTKPSAYSTLSPDALIQKELSDRADSVFQLTKPSFADGKGAIKFTPYVKK